MSVIVYNDVQILISYIYRVEHELLQIQKFYHLNIVCNLKCYFWFIDHILFLHLSYCLSDFRLIKGDLCFINSNSLQRLMDVFIVSYEILQFSRLLTTQYQCFILSSRISSGFVEQKSDKAKMNPGRSITQVTKTPETLHNQSVSKNAANQ